MRTFPKGMLSAVFSALASDTYTTLSDIATIVVLCAETREEVDTDLLCDMLYDVDVVGSRRLAAGTLPRFVSALAVFNANPGDEVLDKLAGLANNAIGRYNQRNLFRTLRAWDRLGYTPRSSVLSAFAAQAVQLQKAGELTTKDREQLLAALQRCRAPPASWNMLEMDAFDKAVEVDEQQEEGDAKAEVTTEAKADAVADVEAVDYADEPVAEVEPDDGDQGGFGSATAA